MIGNIKVEPYDHHILIHVRDGIIEQPGQGRALVNPEEARNLINQIEDAIEAVK